MTTLRSTRYVKDLAKYARRGILDWKHVVTGIAGGRPPVDEESSDLIDEAITDPTRSRFFTDAALELELIAWLDGRNRLDSLFSRSHGNLSEQVAQLSSWLAQKFARCHANRIFRPIAKQDLRVHPALWVVLGRDIGAEEGKHLKRDDPSRWVAVLLETAPSLPSSSQVRFVLTRLGHRCASTDLTDCIIRHLRFDDCKSPHAGIVHSQSR